jgi:hypothetical protein
MALFMLLPKSTVIGVQMLVCGSAGTVTVWTVVAPIVSEHSRSERVLAATAAVFKIQKLTCW